MTAAAPVPHKVKIMIIDHLLSESARKGPDAGKVFAREVKLVTGLLARYPDPTFWLGLGLGYGLNSLAFFKTERGAEELEIAWRYYRLTGVQPPSIALDKPTKPESMGDDMVEQVACAGSSL